MKVSLQYYYYIAGQLCSHLLFYIYHKQQQVSMARTHQTPRKHVGNAQQFRRLFGARLPQVRGLSRIGYQLRVVRFVYKHDLCKLLKTRKLSRIYRHLR